MSKPKVPRHDKGPRNTKDPRNDRAVRNAREQLRVQQEQAARRRRDRRVLGIVALVLVVLVVGGGIGYQKWTTSRDPSSAGTTAASNAPVAVTNGKPLVLGKATAPVKIQLYEDFHCPYCAQFEETMGATINSEQEAGRVVVELYPMSFENSGSAPAANAMACAAENGFGPAYYLGLFANHELQWSDDQLLTLAGQVTKTVPDAFRSCVTTKAHQSWVDSINNAAAANGVSSTPTMFFQGKQVNAMALTPASFRSMVDQAATGK